MLRKNGSGLLLSLALVLCVPSSSFSEGYIGTGLGKMSMSRDITEFSGAGRAEGVSVNRFSSDSSLAEMESGGYFFKSAAAGYFFEHLPWLGFEVNYAINEHDMNAAISAKIAKKSDGLRGDLNSVDFTGVVDVNHYSTVVVLLKFRPQKDRTHAGFGIFGGLGLGVDIVHVKEVELLDVNKVKQRDVGGEMMLDFDLLLTAGIDYKIRKDAKAYGEYKYKNAGFGSSAFDGGVDYEFDLAESSFTFGFMYRF
jgi:opacity protein-like surface antigen